MSISDITVQSKPIPGSKFKFDPELGFSQIVGHPVVKYEQDGKYYNQMGLHMGDDPGYKPPKKRAVTVDTNQNGYLSKPEIKSVLDIRKVKYGKNDSRDQLLDRLVNAPMPDEE